MCFFRSGLPIPPPRSGGFVLCLYPMMMRAKRSEVDQRVIVALCYVVYLGGYGSAPTPLCLPLPCAPCAGTCAVPLHYGRALVSVSG